MTSSPQKNLHDDTPIEICDTSNSRHIARLLAQNETAKTIIAINQYLDAPSWHPCKQYLETIAIARVAHLERMIFGENLIQSLEVA